MKGIKKFLSKRKKISNSLKTMHEEENLKEILLKPTPISHRMLMAAWDDLSFESQCEILLAYNKNREVGRFTIHTDEFLKKSIKSPYPLVRYLASKVLFGSKLGYREQWNRKLR